MPKLVIRHASTALIAALHARAAAHGNSAEVEAARILAFVLGVPGEGCQVGLGTRIRARFAGIGWDDESAGRRSDRD